MKIRCRSRRTLFLAVCQSICPSRGVSSGPFTSTSSPRCPTCPSVPGSSSSSSQAHLTASAPFRAGPCTAHIRPVFRGPAGGGPDISPGFLLPFGLRRWLLGHPIPAGELGLPHSRLTGANGPDLDGVTAFRTHELRPGWVPSLPRGRRCSYRPTGVFGRRLPLLSGHVPAPRSSIPSARAPITGHRRGFAQFPVRSSPRLRPPGWNGEPLGFSPSSHPADQEPDDARRGRDGPGARPEITSFGITPTSLPTQPLTACDLASHRAGGQDPPAGGGRGAERDLR